MLETSEDGRGGASCGAANSCMVPPCTACLPELVLRIDLSLSFSGFEASLNPGLEFDSRLRLKLGFG